MSKLKELIQEAIEALKKVEVEVDNPTPVEPTEPVKPIEPEIKRNIIVIETTQPQDIPATENNSFVDNEGNDKKFTMRIPLFLKDGDTGIFLSKSGRTEGKGWTYTIDEKEIELRLQSGVDRSSIRMYLSLDDLPKNEKFVIHVTSEGVKSINGFKFFVNTRRISFTHIGESSYSGMNKNSAPISLLKNNWNDLISTVETGEVLIELDRIWPLDELIEDYQTLFNIKDMFLKPNEEGNYDIPVEPNTGEDKAEELLEAFYRIPNGKETDSKIKVKTGKYLVDMDGKDFSKEGEAIHLYGRHDLDNYFNGATLYTTKPAITDFSGDGDSKRLQLNVVDSHRISVRDLNIVGSLDQSNYLKALAFEHAISNIYSSDLVYKNISVKNVWGDGLEFKYCKNIDLENILTDGTNRQGISASNGVENLRIKNFKAYNGIRASLDLEPENVKALIDGVELSNSYLSNHIAAGGSGLINNVNIHHNEYIRTIIMKGNIWIDNPDYNPNLPESAENPENIRLPLRENWDISDNENIGGFGTPSAMVRVSACKNVLINRNNISVSTTQGRFGVDLNYCAGRVELSNTYDNPSIIRLRNCDRDIDIKINDVGYKDNIYIIEVDGVREVTGTNSELLSLIEKKGY